MKFRKRIILFIFSSTLFLYVPTYAQQPLNQINITNFTVKSKLPADISTWGSIPAGIMLVAQKLPTAQLQGVKLVLQIKQGGSKICGYSAQATTILDAFAVRNFTSNELTNMLTQCPKLGNNMYSICAQFYNVDNYPISREICKEFMVGDITINYNAPQNILPATDKIFTETNIKAPIQFKWLPVLPKPKYVSYKLRVWQVMQGQTPTLAIKANEPIVEKDIQNISQATIANLIINPCKPPYLCDFVWTVQALDKDGKTIGKNDGMSEWFLFKIR